MVCRRSCRARSFEVMDKAFQNPVARLRVELAKTVTPHRNERDVAVGLHVRARPSRRPAHWRSVSISGKMSVTPSARDVVVLLEISNCSIGNQLSKTPMKKKLTACPGWLGLSEDRTAFIFIPERAEIVREIFQASISGLGGYTIAKQLNAKKVSAFGPSCKWDQSTIHNLLRNRATVGEHQPKKYPNGKEVPIGEPIPGYYPAVIDEEMFQAAQLARQKNLASGRGRKGHLINLFAGIPTCAYCGSAVKFHSNGNTKSLVCSTLLSGGSCYRMAWSYRDFEHSFFEFIRAHHASPAIEPHERETLGQILDQLRSLSGPTSAMCDWLSL